MEVIKCYCNNCKGETNHTIEAEYHFVDCDEINDEHGYAYKEWAREHYQIIQCDRCKKSPTLKIKFCLYGMPTEINPYTGKTETTTEIGEIYYPKRLLSSLVEKKFTNIPPIIKTVYSEVLFCYNYEKLVLCAAGIKSLAEGICDYLEIPGKSSLEKIQNLIKDKIIPWDLKSTLYSYNFSVNKCFERLYKAEKSELKIIIELLEEIMYNIFNNNK